MNLYERFVSLHNGNGNDIIYYSNNRINPIENTGKSWEFILNYFKLGRKEKAFYLKFIDEHKEKGKHVHSVSMYYLGCLIKDLINDELAS